MTGAPGSAAGAAHRPLTEVEARALYEADVASRPDIREGLPRPAWDDLTDFERSTWGRPTKAWPEPPPRAPLPLRADRPRAGSRR